MIAVLITNPLSLKMCNLKQAVNFVSKTEKLAVEAWRGAALAGSPPQIPESYFLLRFGGGASGCTPVMLERTLSKASWVVISLLRPLFWRYLCSPLQVRQRVLSTSSPIKETMAWSVVRLQREQWSSISSPSRMVVPPVSGSAYFARKWA
jgi:hypothetical protein